MGLDRTCRLGAGLSLLLLAGSAQAQMRITEWMYDGAGGEFIELTNVGATAVDMAGWRYDDDSASYAAGFDLSGFGVVAPGESVVLSETTAAAFRTSWGLCANAKVLGGYTNNLGRADQINLFDGAQVRVDRLTYGDQAIPGTIRTQNRSGWVSAAGLGVDNVAAWTLSAVGDSESSWTSADGPIGSPGRSTRATVSFDPCAVTAPGVPTGVAAVAGNASVTLNWTAPADATGILSYTITPYLLGVAQTTQVTPDATTTYRVTGLLNGVAYTFTVAATSAAGTGAPSAPTAPVTPSSGSARIDAGSNFACALDSGGAPYCWGSDANGRLGNGPVTGNFVSPYPVDLSGLPAGTRFATIAAGGTHACTLTTAGEAYCWGADSAGQLGNGTALTADQDRPSAVDVSALPAGTRWTSISVGSQHSCAVAADGVGYCWGYGYNGRLGTAITESQPRPVALTAPLAAGEVWESFSLGSSSSCGLTTAGNVYCWGWNNTGQMGIGVSNSGYTAYGPTALDVSALPAGTHFNSVSMGDGHACAVTTAGVGYCWGQDTTGQIGNGPVASTQYSPSAVSTASLPAGSAFVQIVAGGTNSCGLTTQGTAWCWGFGSWGALGTGTSATQNAPTPVDSAALPAGTTFVQLTTDTNLTCAASADDHFYCWGRDNNGQLGNGPELTADPSLSPTPVAPMLPAVGLPPSLSIDQTTVIGAVGDPTNPIATLTVGDPDTALDLLTFTASSSTASVIAPSGISVTGSGTERSVSFAPIGRGTSTVTITVADPQGNTQSVTLAYAASAQIPDPSGRYHHHISDASAALDVGDGYQILLNDETNTIFLHRSGQSGPPVKTWSFTTTQLGTGSEIDFEGIARSGDLVLLTGSHGNNRSGAARPERRTFVAATISGSGAATELVFRGRYNNLWAELRSWDQSNGHGLGANALGFIAATAGGVQPNPPAGFNVEGLEFAPDGTTVYLGFRAPTILRDGRPHALIVPLSNPAAITAGAPGTGPAVFGAPILLDLDGRSIRALASNAQGDYLISAGPSPANESWALYTWDGRAEHPARFNRTLPNDDGLTGGAWEAIGAVPHPLVAGATVRVITDSGDTNFYGTGATKDLQQVFQKSYSQAFVLAAVPDERPAMRITEWMYDGAGGEFIELTNVGSEPVDMTGWRYDDDSADPAIGFDLSGFGSVQPGESVVLTESDAQAFRGDWALCAGAKVLGGYTNGLGRADQINLFDASGTRVDRLTYGDQTFPGSIRTQGRSGWVSAAGLGADDVFAWTLSSVGDGEGSVASSGGAIGSPGRSTRAGTAYDPCGSVTEYLLTVAIEGAGLGTVTGTGIDCPADCDQRYVAGTDVPLVATPASGFVFGGWGGACSGSAGCSVTMDADRTVTATFVPAPVAALVFEPAELAFGDVETGASSPAMTATLRNSGSAAAAALAFLPPGAGFSADTTACGATLAAGTSCTVTLRFAPTAEGEVSAALQVTASGGIAATLALGGTGIAPADPVVDVAVAIQARRDFLYRGQLLDYLVTVRNLGPDAATAAGVETTLAAALDPAFASWQCIGPSSSGCAASGQGALAATGLAIPAGGSVSYLVSAPLRWDAEGSVTTQARAQHAGDPEPANDIGEASGLVVLHRDGFEVYGEGTAELPLAAVDARLRAGDRLTLTWPVPGQAPVETLLAAAADSDGLAAAAFRLERLNAGAWSGLRLVARDADGNEYTTAWTSVAADAELQVTVVDMADAADAQAAGRELRVTGTGVDLQLPLGVVPADYRLWTAVPVQVTPVIVE